MPMTSNTEDLVRKVIAGFGSKKMKIAVAESCTGGLLGATLTSIPGASDVFERGFITYSNESKIEMLGVEAERIATHGAVSAEVAEKMAEGAIERSQADLAVSITGCAGPKSASPDKPVGLVFFGICKRDGACFHLRTQFAGDRNEIRRQSVLEALNLLLIQAEAH